MTHPADDPRDDRPRGDDTPGGGTRLARDLYLRLAANTFVTLFWRRRLLDDMIDRLRQADYAVVVLDASGWTVPDDLHEDIARALDFPDYYGGNLDALNDCMSDVVSREYGFPADATGLVLVFTHYDAFARACPSPAQIVLDILADQARRAALVGTRVLCLVHSDDPGIAFRPVGATPVMWNAAEWLNSRRTPESFDE